MNKNNMSEIQVWNSFGAVPVYDNSDENMLKVNVHDDATQVPEELEKKIDENWQKNLEKNKNAKDNQILYITKPIETIDNNIVIDTNVRGFRYTQAFNRNADFQEMTDDLNKYKLLSISTHAHLLTNDNKLLFGTKKNQFNQISGFSGFPNAAEDCVDNNGKQLAIYQTMLNRLKGEMGYLVSAVKDIDALGVVYVNTPALRGTDTDYLIKLDETAEKAAERFQESFQFDKELHVVDFNPNSIMDFIKKIHSEEKKMSKYALGCEYLVFKTYFGEKEANKMLDTVRGLGITMSTDNETNYFK